MSAPGPVFAADSSSPWESDVINGTAQFVAGRMQSEFVQWFLTDAGMRICEDASSKQLKPFFPSFCAYYTAYKNQPIGSVATLQAAVRKDLQNLPAVLIAQHKNGKHWGPVFADLLNVLTDVSKNHNLADALRTSTLTDNAKSLLDTDCGNSVKEACAIEVMAAALVAKQTASKKATDADAQAAWKKCDTSPGATKPTGGVITDLLLVQMGTVCEQLAPANGGKLGSKAQELFQVIVADSAKVSDLVSKVNAAENSWDAAFSSHPADSVADGLTRVAQGGAALITVVQAVCTDLAIPTSDCAISDKSKLDALSKSPFLSPNVPLTEQIIQRYVTPQWGAVLVGVISDMGSNGLSATEALTASFTTGTGRGILVQDCKDGNKGACALGALAIVAATKKEVELTIPVPAQSPNHYKSHCDAAAPNVAANTTDAQVYLVVKLCDQFKNDATLKPLTDFIITNLAAINLAKIQKLQTVFEDIKRTEDQLASLAKSAKTSAQQVDFGFTAATSLVNLVQDACTLAEEVRCGFKDPALLQKIRDLQMMAASASAGKYNEMLTSLASYLQAESESKEKDKENQNLIRYVTFLSDLGNAKSSADVKIALDDAASPTGAWKLKRQHRAMVSFGALGGLFYGTDTIGTLGGLGNKDNAVEASKSVPNGVAKYSRPVGGVAAPLGVDFSWPIPNLWDGFPTSSTWGLFLSVVDLGNLVATDFQSGQSSSNSASAKPNPSPTIDQVYAPGYFLRLGMGNTPIVLAVGQEYLPGSLEVQTTTGETKHFDQVRTMLVLAIDIVIFPIY